MARVERRNPHGGREGGGKLHCGGGRCEGVGGNAWYFLGEGRGGFEVAGEGRKLLTALRRPRSEFAEAQTQSSWSGVDTFADAQGVAKAFASQQDFPWCKVAVVSR